MLYGYHLAKEAIYRQRRIIVTEGYIDTILLRQAGFATAVATLGTALGKDHLPLRLARASRKSSLRMTAILLGARRRSRRRGCLRKKTAAWRFCPLDSTLPIWL
ncbi:MAG: toprim domain-containing protein [Helicobacter sp.]|nr:toprim domain-containing protein [Helicobacter sp.]